MPATTQLVRERMPVLQMPPPAVLPPTAEIGLEKNELDPKAAFVLIAQPSIASEPPFQMPPPVPEPAGIHAPTTERHLRCETLGCVIALYSAEAGGFGPGDLIERLTAIELLNLRSALAME